MSYFLTVQFISLDGKTAQIPRQKHSTKGTYRSVSRCAGKDLDTTLSNSESEPK